MLEILLAFVALKAVVTIYSVVRAASELPKILEEL